MANRFVRRTGVGGTRGLAAVCALGMALCLGVWGTPAAAGSARPVLLPTTVAQPGPQVSAVESLRFSSLVTGLSSGPEEDDLALRLADGSAVVIHRGAVAFRLPAPVADISWILDTTWVLYETGGRYFLTPASVREPVDLPACIASPGVQALPQAVAWWCGGNLHVLAVPAGQASVDVARATAYAVPKQPVPQPGAFSVSPDGRLVAVRTATGIRYYSLRHEHFWQTSRWTRGNPPVQFVWSSQDVLAIANRGGAFFWGPSTPPSPYFPFETHVQWMQWLPGGHGVLLLNQTNPGATVPRYSLDLMEPDGRYGQVLQGRLGYVLGLGANGGVFWREEGVRASVYTLGASGAGPGPFGLEAVPLHLRSLHVPVQPFPGWIRVMLMVSPTTGWAWSTDPTSRFMVTTDGGAVWRDVTPSGYGTSVLPQVSPNLSVVGPGGRGAAASCRAASAMPCASLVLSGVALSDHSTFALMKTTNGGGSWTEMVVPSLPTGWEVAGVDGGTFGGTWESGPYVTFGTPALGWALDHAGARYVGKILRPREEVFRTADGGRRWVAVGRMSSGEGLPGGPAPDGVPSDVYFHNALDGWLVGASYGSAWLYATRDGGASWQNVRLAVPAAYRSGRYRIETHRPVFYSRLRGVLVVTFGVADNRHTELFQTTDGGRTWRGTAVVFASGAVAVANPRDAFAVSVSGKALEVTTDGGASWRTVPSNVSLFGARVEFANARDGWMWNWMSDGQELWRTSDGGAHWSLVHGILVNAPGFGTPFN